MIIYEDQNFKLTSDGQYRAAVFEFPFFPLFASKSSYTKTDRHKYFLWPFSEEKSAEKIFPKFYAQLEKH